MPFRPSGIRMQRSRFIVNSDRSTKKDQPINAGTDGAAHQAIVGTLSMHPENMQAAGIPSGNTGPCADRVRRGGPSPSPYAAATNADGQLP